jgi:hypothetical protein
VLGKLADNGTALVLASSGSLDLNPVIVVDVGRIYGEANLNVTIG